MSALTTAPVGIGPVPESRQVLGCGPMGHTRGNDRADAHADFVDFVHARQHALQRFAYLLTSNHHTAEDLVQTALAKTYLSWDKLRDRGALDAYVRRIIVNENASMWRRAWRRNERPSDELPDSGHGDHQRSDVDPVDRDAMWQVVQQLPTKQRAAVVLRYYEDLSEADTAAILGCSVGNVKSQTSRAIASMRAAVTANPELLGGES
jgi:RNA polymerase sigma-70 factor (sigma-E family)